MVGPAATPGKRYQDFEIIIERSADTVYPVRCRAPNGASGHSAFDFPFTGVDLERRLGLIERSLLSSLHKLRRAPQEELPVQDFGRDLFEALFTGEVRELYSACLSSLGEEGGLRVRLSIEEPQLAALPWEFLYDPRQRSYLCLSARTPLVRQIDIARATSPLTVKFPLRVLGMVASPTNLEALDMEAEQRHIQQALAGPIAAGQVQMEWLVGSTWRDLLEAMEPGRGPWHVFHFIGHGGFDAKREEGYICLVNSDGRSRDLYASELAMLLGDHPSLRLVVLNACQGGRSASGLTNDQFTSTAATLLNAGLPAVLAMQYAISDTAAIELARSFYSALVEEAPVEMALTEARKAIRLNNQSLEWAVPVLYSRTSDGVLYRKGQEETPAIMLKPDPVGPQSPIRENQPPAAETQPVQEKPIRRPRPAKLAKPEAFKPWMDFNQRTKQLTFWLAEQSLLEMVYIPAGPFMMGANDTSKKYSSGDVKPSHELTMYPYWIGKYPVTEAQATQMLYLMPPENTEVIKYSEKSKKLPATKWAFEVIIRAISYLNQAFKENLPAPFLFNLPTEAEWEKAARGSDGRIYPHGMDDFYASYRCNCLERMLNAPSNVDQFSPSGDSSFGCADMAGNVWEVTRTIYANQYLWNRVSLYYTYPFRHDDGRNASTEPKAPYIIRGGSYKEKAVRCNAINRDWQYGDQPGEDSGFRLVLTPLDEKGKLRPIDDIDKTLKLLKEQAAVLRKNVG